ncbi:MAG: UDP-N-acetylmuramoylalanine--D-glutamate ligase [Candidatus Hydrogenedentes bacterium ADurb.Bin101]|jgi:UDP-N-acetylmuramoylalanine--D-glutamate ligase|nr:UDP-N-acetylmuramoyl-L-alanine--D-glutamate ligase [Candidatus Hydrogenedentota bacterium]OQC03764.1 MAG: UDP-N-acetylmuramoylalanine--D-glutamate ligase [Candidatus Hydrogenedentes bacterium ADurb.Bin101]HOC68911.1 UDP-N-acetylmuramoyl-L-alanine--D-glutamate ligase [Candidatus Hydrogenedentota bacterium]HOH28515.1 UDP-N-acetylmuramoyl-L-alanine--D-glutamate ligase [Candidatus Hydrogenedentota bacterium]
MPKETSLTTLKDLAVVLVGLGRSSIAAARLLQQQGARPFISDSNDNAVIQTWREEARRFDLPCETGGHSPGVFAKADLVLVSPGVPAAAPCLNASRTAGIPVLGELEFACRFCSSRLLAVTGTNGKTTVTTLLAKMVAASGHTVALAGNNDTPLSQVLLENTRPEYIVLEVSSYQLETTDLFHPVVAAVLNLTPDHLSRHGDMQGYAAAKARIFMRQGVGDAAVVNRDDPRTADMPLPEGVERFGFSLEQPGKKTLYADAEYIYFEHTVVASLSDNPLPGRHNLANVLASLAVMRAAGFPWEGPVAALRAFQGVEHRIELVMRLNGVDFYNDSKSTNIDSLRVALESFSQPVVLIAGGRGKGSDYSVLRPLIQRHVKHLVLIGEDAPKMAAAFAGIVPISHAGTMMAAAEEANRRSEPGDVALLSPACASFDMYDNFEARGKEFKECVRCLTVHRASRT